MTTTIGQIAAHFKRADPTLYCQFKSLSPPKLLVSAPPDRYFSHLAREIINQQLSGVVAQVIFDRFQRLFPHRRITPAHLLSIADSNLRAIGLSRAKTLYIKNLARHVILHPHRFTDLAQQSDREVIKYLTAVKGIGPWTAAMFLMFTLGREDIFSPHDLGLRKAIVSLYDTNPDPSAKQLEQISQPWSPYRTYACLTLWQHIDD